MNIIEQIKALFSKKTWSSSDANVSAQKILLGDANAEPTGIIGVNDLASVLGGTLPGSRFVIIATAYIGSGGNPHNYPTQYGTHIKFPAYYAIHLLVANDGKQLWVGTSASTDDYPYSWNAVI